MTGPVPGGYAYWEDLPRVIARGRRTTAKTTITTETGIMRLDDIPVEAGTLLEISTSNANIDATNAGAIASLRMRYLYSATAGGAAGSSDTLQNYWRDYQDDATNSNTGILQTYLPIAATGYLSLFFSVFMHAGTGSVQLFASGADIFDAVVKCWGPDPGDSAVIL